MVHFVLIWLSYAFRKTLHNGHLYALDVGLDCFQVRR
jgi:hypothetical protein